MPLLVAQNGIQTHIEKTYAQSGLDLSFSKKKGCAQPNDLHTKDGSREMVEVKDYYVAEAELCFAALFTDRSIGSEAQCERIRKTE